MRIGICPLLFAKPVPETEAHNYIRNSDPMKIKNNMPYVSTDAVDVAIQITQRNMMHYRDTPVSTEEEFTYTDLRPHNAAINREKLRHINQVVDRLGIPVTHENPICVPIIYDDYEQTVIR